MNNLEDITGTIVNQDCIQFMREKINENSIDLIVTSCPYGVGIQYDNWDDDKEFEEYKDFSREWLFEAFRVLKEDGRIALNIPYEINRQGKGGRIFFVSEMWQIMKEIGFGFFGVVDLEESSPHRSKTTAWGSWMSPSSPYIYNPKECVILAYKSKHKKIVKGTPQWDYQNQLVDDPKTGTQREKKVYDEKDKRDFIELVYGQWNYFADTRSMTKATFSLDIPWKAIKILTYKEDIVFDPFNGSGTTCLAAEKLGRKWIGCDISENYCEVARQRIKDYQIERDMSNTLFCEEIKSGRFLDI